MAYKLPIGANIIPEGTRFRVWAESVSSIDVVIYPPNGAAQTFPLQPIGDGYYQADVADVGAGTRYSYRLNGVDDRPDPASRFQPEGVHGPSEVVDPSFFRWNDREWQGISIDQAIIYELHIGTFTPEGTFEAAIARLDSLVELGVTAIQLMPVADFPGDRNWGYDGVCLFAPARAYGGPEGLRKLVDAAHERGLAVLLDVVYNHLGPDGNYLRQFSQHYFTQHHTTPWGDALNFDDTSSANVRAFFAANAAYWANEYHLDGLRFDAIHAIKDDSPTHVLAEIAARVRLTLGPNRNFLFIAEDERNEPQVVRPAELLDDKTIVPGYGFDAVWADDFHHQMRVALTGENEGYYADYSGSIADLAATLEQGWFYTGQSSAWSGHQRGAPTDGLPTTAFVHCLQNHDQVGNRAFGDRLNAVVDPDAYRVASALLLLSPYVPMLWEGQEWAASTPFLYFTDHNPELGRLITEGRRREFGHFTAFAGEEVPDPQAEETFLRSKLDWAERNQPSHNEILLLYQDLLALRRASPALQNRSRDSFQVQQLGDSGIALRRTGNDETMLLIANLRGENRYALAGELAAPEGTIWQPRLSSEEPRYGGDDHARLDGDAAVFVGPGALLLLAVSLES